MKISNIIKKSIATNEEIKFNFGVSPRYLKLRLSLSLLKWLLVLILAFIVLAVVNNNWEFAFGQKTINEDILYNNNIEDSPLEMSENKLEVILFILIIIYILIIIPSVLFYNLYYLKVSREFVFTNKRLIVKTGWIETQVVSSDYNRITDISITQGIVDRLLNIGTLAISTAGSEGYQVSLAHINEAHSRKKMLHELSEEHKKSDKLNNHRESKN